MIKILHGFVNGKTIELTEDPGMPAGQEVEVRMTSLPAKQTTWGDGLRRCAGALTNGVTEDDDRILEEIYRERKQDSRPEPME